MPLQTIGIDFKIKTVEIEGKRIKLQIWDTAGQERFRTITTGGKIQFSILTSVEQILLTAYYRGAMGILLVYDVTDENSFQNIRNWVRNIDQHAAEGVEKVLIGNKADMKDQQVVDSSRGSGLATEYGIKFFETSAKQNKNVSEAFYEIAADIKKHLMSENVPETSNL